MTRLWVADIIKLKNHGGGKIMNIEKLRSHYTRRAKKEGQILEELLFDDVYEGIISPDTAKEIAKNKNIDFYQAQYQAIDEF